jgi:hypothetical protein
MQIAKKAKKREKLIDEKTQQERNNNSSYDDEIPFLDYDELLKTKFQNFTMILQIDHSYYTTPYQGRKTHKKSKTIKLKYKLNFEQLKDESTFLKANELNDTEIVNLPDINTNKKKKSNIKKLKGNKSCIHTEKKDFKLPQIKKVLFKKEIFDVKKNNKNVLNTEKKRAKTNIRSNYLDYNNNKILNKTTFDLNKSN